MATKKATTTKSASAKRSVVAKNKTSVKSVAATAKKASLSEHVSDSLKSVSLWRSLAAEFIGTFLLATAVIAGQGQPIIMMFALVGIVLIIGGISGGHVNPAITIGALVTRRIGWLRALGYIVVQVLGAMLALVTLSGFLGGAEPVSEQAALYGQSAASLFQATDLTTLTGKEWYVFFAELLGTAVLAFAVANAVREAKDRLVSAFSAGLGIFIALMIAVSSASYVGASAIINPALAVSLQAVSWSVWPLAAYVLAPVIGGIIGFVVYDIVRGRK